MRAGNTGFIMYNKMTPSVIPTLVALEQFLRQSFSHAVMLPGLLGKCQSLRLGSQDE